jgi:hypothetical protein
MVENPLVRPEFGSFPLLLSGRFLIHRMIIATQRRGKQAHNNGRTACSMRSVPRYYNRDKSFEMSVECPAVKRRLYV